MLVAPHAVTGAALGALVDRPAVALPAALASHYLLDMVPHWQETLPPYTPHAGTWVRIPLDVALSFGLVSAMARSHRDRASSIWAGAVAAVIPDVDSFVAMDGGLRRVRLLGRYLRWHLSIQQETSSLWGLLPQLAVIALGLTLLDRGTSWIDER